MMYRVIAILTLVGLSNSAVVKLTGENGGKIYKGEWFIKAYAPWCPACQSIAGPWAELGKWAEQTDYNIAEIDITEGHSIGNQLMATRIPAIYHVKDGVFSQYEGGRGVDAWKDFLISRQSEKLPHFPWYRSPGYPPMIVFGGLMSFAINVHDFQKYMTNELKIPSSLAIGLLLIVPVVLFISTILVGTYLLHSMFGKPKRPDSIGLQRPKPRHASTSSSSPPPEENTEALQDLEGEEIDEIEEIIGSKEEEDEVVRRRK